MALTYWPQMVKISPKHDPDVYVAYAQWSEMGLFNVRVDYILVQNGWGERRTLHSAYGLPPHDENGHAYIEEHGYFIQEKKMPNINILSFNVGNIVMTKRSTGVDAMYGSGERKSFVFLAHDGQPFTSSICNLEHYFIGEDREGADLMEFSGMDYVRTVKRVVKKSWNEMFKELLEMLEGCLVLSNPSGDTFVCYKNECILLGCGDVFKCLRPYLSIKLDKPQKYGIIEKQSLFIFSKEMEKLIKENENNFSKVYNRLKGM